MSARRLLVIDDDESILKVVTRILGASYELRSSQTVEQALQLFRSGERFDAILSDLSLPDKDGADFYSALLLLDPGQASKVIFMTGGSHSPKMDAFLETNAQPRLPKPFKIETLKETVAGFIDPPRPH